MSRGGAGVVALDCIIVGVDKAEIEGSRRGVRLGGVERR